LPRSSTSQTNALIVEPEYEAAWTQAERAFQDVLKLALADTSAERRGKSIRNTKQLREDSEAIRKTLASIAREPDAPLLSLTFSEPGKPRILPHARDKDRSLQFVL
jgi:hypothetical protein